MTESEIELRRVIGDRETYVPLLLEADESEPVLRSYLNDGELFQILLTDDLIGVCLLVGAGDAVEIKNIALEETSRGRGFGRAAIAAIASECRARDVRRLVVGTADTSTGTIAFYRRVGFREAGTRRGFFDAYPEPVVEDGRTAHDMVVFEMPL